MKIKVLHVIPTLRKGGAERLAITIFNGFKERDDIEAKIIAFDPTNEYQFLSDGIDVVPMPSSVVASLFKKWHVDTDGFDQFVKQFNPDIIHSHLMETELVSRIHPNPGTVYFSHLHSDFDDQFDNFSIDTLFSKKKLANYIDKRRMVKIYRKLDNHFISISEFITKYFSERLPADLSKNIHTLYNCTDYNRYKNPGYMPPDRNKKINCVCIARLYPIKNQRFLIGVFKILKDRGINIKLDIIGEGGDMEILQTMINEAGLNDTVFLKGIINNVDDYLKAAHIYTYAALDGLFGISMLESMAAGLPFVALKANDDGDRLVNGVNGFIVEEKNAEKYADKVIELIDNPELAKKMSIYNDAFAQKYDIKAYTENLINFYKQALLSKKK